MTLVLVHGPWKFRTHFYVRLGFGVFPTVGLATYKKLKLPRRLRFKEVMKITLNTTHGGIPAILPKAANQLGKIPFDLNLFHKLASCKL